MPDDNQSDLLELTAEIVAAHVAGNTVSPADVPSLIETIHTTLSGLGKEAAAPAKPQGAVSARASIKADGLTSMIDGRKYQSLKRHLTQHGYTPESYREAFGLPRDYPMTGKAYSERRSALAKSFGLGRKPKEVAAKAVRTVKGGLKDALASAEAHLGGEGDRTPAKRGKRVKAGAA